MIQFKVFGVPVPQGSKRQFLVNGKPRMVEAAGSRHATWRDQVATAAHLAYHEHGQQTGPLGVTIDARFPMPASRKAADRKRGWMWKTTAPDIDKLARAVLDGLQESGLIVNDSNVVRLFVYKSEATDWTGAEITVYEVTQ